MNLKPNNLFSKIKRFFLCKSTFNPLFIAIVICQTSFYPLFSSSAEIKEKQSYKTQSFSKNSSSDYEDYILGAGDVIFIEIENIGEFSGIFEIGPTGSVYLPRLRDVKAEGLTVDEFRQKITREYLQYLNMPEIFIRPISYRPIRVYVGGEVSRPGFYTLTGVINTDKNIVSTIDETISDNNASASVVFPTIFDAIQISRGVTAYSDLSKVTVIRKISVGKGGGSKKAELNFLSLLTDGDESQNIRLFDDDIIQIKKSNEILRDQLLKSSSTNLSPDRLSVFVSGRVRMPGRIELPQGSSLNQALIASDGPKKIRGKVEFVRFRRGGEAERRLINYSPNDPIASYNNPILMSGDLIRVQDNLVSSVSTVLGEFTAPFIGIYSIYNFFNGIF